MTRIPCNSVCASSVSASRTSTPGERASVCVSVCGEGGVRRAAAASVQRRGCAGPVRRWRCGERRPRDACASDERESERERQRSREARVKSPCALMMHKTIVFGSRILLDEITSCTTLTRAGGLRLRSLGSDVGVVCRRRCRWARCDRCGGALSQPSQSPPVPPGPLPLRPPPPSSRVSPHLGAFPVLAPLANLSGISHGAACYWCRNPSWCAARIPVRA